MAYRLALDVGTASCGLVVWELDEAGQPSKLAYDSLDIWSEPLQPAKSGGVGEPKKAARRAARMMRRGIYRRARKLRHIAHLGSLLNLQTPDPSPLGTKERIRNGGRAGQDVYRLRARAAIEQIELDELLRVLLHLAKNRGPSGDWVYAEPDKPPSKGKRSVRASAVTSTDASVTADTDKNVAEDKRGVIAGVRKLEGLMAEATAALGKDAITLGQYLDYRRKRSESVILGKPDVGLYPSRRMVEQEFDQIWQTQAEFHTALRSPDVRQKFFHAIFDQRPLKSPAPMVGRCPLEPTLPRAPAAQMAAQSFRIEKQIADLRWGIGRDKQALSPEQKGLLRKLLNDANQLTQKGELSFQKTLPALDASGFPGPQGCDLNMNRSSRESLKGNTTLAAFRKLGLEEEWQTLDEKTQIQAINFLADLGSPDALDSDAWHLNFETTQVDPETKRCKKRKFTPALVSFINQMRQLGSKKFGRLSTMGFDNKRMGYSIKALKNLATLMQEGWDEHAAVDQAYPEHHQAQALSETLPLPDETGNTVVDVALRQVYRAVRRTMQAMGGQPAQVIVELSRDMALGLKQRGEIETRINVNNKARKAASDALVGEGQQATDRNIHRYLLWESQSHYCPYCADRISLGDALSSVTQREHILPRSLTRVGGKRSQLVLAHQVCNQQKDNHTPWQAFGDDESRWRIIEDRAAILEKNKQWSKAKLLLLKDWDEEVLDNEAIKGFTDRQFHESSWIAKLTALWLRRVCSDVAVSRGQMTAYLRRIWKLDTVIPEVRNSTGLPVLDRDGQPISTEEFERHKSWWEGHDERAGGVSTERKPDKRIDHRHHLVDALVISLTDRKLFKKMADNYKVESEKARRGVPAKLTRHVDPPFAVLRDLAVNIVTNAEIRHKMDRHPDGQLFDEHAYGISREPNDEGKHLLAISKPLTALIDNKGNANKTRRALEKIESVETRASVLRAFDQRVAAGKSIKQIFDDPILHPQFSTPIRRVRVLSNSEETAATVTHTNRLGEVLSKRYPHAGNAYLEICVEDIKLVGKPRLVAVQEAMKEKGLHPPFGVTRFWKGDTVCYGGKHYLIGMITAYNDGRLCLVPVTETCTFGELKKRGLTLRTVSGNALAQVTVINV